MPEIPTPHTNASKYMENSLWLNGNNNTKDNTKKSNTTSNAKSDGSRSNSNGHSKSTDARSSNPSQSRYYGHANAATSKEPVNVGDSSQPLEDSEADQSSDSKSKSYEVSKSIETQSADSNNLLYALIGILAIGIVLGLGYMRRK